MSNFKLFSKPLLFLFIIVSLVDVVAIVLENPFWQSLSKPLIIPSLMLYYMASVKKVNRIYLIALFFSFLGDVLLMDKNNLFLYGIGAFLITQVLYVFIFYKGLAGTPMAKKVLALLPFAVFYSVLITVLKPGLGEFFVPVCIYGAVISVFGSVSFLKYLHEKSTETIGLLSGAILFIISDSMIALNKFQQEHFIYPVAIMVTYILAQFLIARFMMDSQK